MYKKINKGSEKNKVENVPKEDIKEPPVDRRKSLILESSHDFRSAIGGRETLREGGGSISPTSRVFRYFVSVKTCVIGMRER